MLILVVDGGTTDIVVPAAVRFSTARLDLTNWGEPVNPIFSTGLVTLFFDDGRETHMFATDGSLKLEICRHARRHNR